MGRGKKKPNPEKQLIKILNSKFTPGVSKVNSSQENIRSFGTYKVYLQQGKRFINYCKNEHKVHNLKNMKQYIPQYIMHMRDVEWLSNRTIKTARAALCKIFDLKCSELMKEIAKLYFDGNERAAEERLMFRRQDITRSRGYWTPDRIDDSVGITKEIKLFCQSCGLRRQELESIKKEHVKVSKDGSVVLHLTGNTKDATRENLDRVKTKGGKSRDVEFLLTEQSKEILKKWLNMNDKGEYLCPYTLSSKLDIHAYRSDYANALYLKYAEPIENINQKERIPSLRPYKKCSDGRSRVARDGMVSRIYRCGDELKGVCLDRVAMRIVSKNLGHNRESVFAMSYFKVSCIK